MLLIKFKTNSKMKHLVPFVCAFGLLFHFGHAQKPLKTKLKEANNTDVEIVEIVEISEEVLKFVPFVIVDNVPYPSECKDSETTTAMRKCVAEYIQKHTANNFNTEIATKLGMSPGIKSRVLVRFMFDATGKVTDIKGRASHPELAKEAERVIQLLPEFTPGEHQGEQVAVAYTLPIKFLVPEKAENGKTNNKN